MSKSLNDSPVTCEPLGSHNAHMALNGECPNCGATGRATEFPSNWTPEQIVAYVEELYST